MAQGKEIGDEVLCLSGRNHLATGLGSVDPGQVKRLVRALSLDLAHLKEMTE